MRDMLLIWGSGDLSSSVHSSINHQQNQPNHSPSLGLSFPLIKIKGLAWLMLDFLFLFLLLLVYLPLPFLYFTHLPFYFSFCSPVPGFPLLLSPVSLPPLSFSIIFSFPLPSQLFSFLYPYSRSLACPPSFLNSNQKERSIFVNRTHC